MNHTSVFHASNFQGVRASRAHRTESGRPARAPLALCSERLRVRFLAVLVICCALVSPLFGTVERLDENGKVAGTTDASPGLRIAPKDILNTLYGRRIIVLSEPKDNERHRKYPAPDYKPVNELWVRLTAAAGELSSHLEQMTGQKFETTTEDATEGIVLARSDAGGLDLPGLKALAGKGPEAFLIQSDGKNKLYLVGNSDLAIQHAVYAYLDMLGSRWFFPGDNWTVIPKLAGIGVNVHAIVSPAFTSRRFFGTGGPSSLRHPYDPEDRVAQRWMNWTNRNRFGSSYATAGHQYQDFVAKNKALFEAHPEYRPEINGERVPYSKDMKLCYSNPEVIDLYVKDRVAAAQDILNKQSPKSMFCVSVEPSDHGGHCECPECQKLGSVTDRVFSLANHVARALRAISPYAYANLYAYHLHSPPANIPLEPNIFVQVAAYGFNTSGLSAKDLIQAWGKRSHALGVYDYWCIPQWGGDMPYLDFVNAYPKRVKFWHDSHVIGFNLETTYSSGAVGPALYMASKLGWDPDQDVKALYEDFYDKAFGAARAPMQRMLERWSRSWKFVDSEIADSFKDINEALQLATDPDVRRRIQDYLGYVEFLRLRYEFKTTDNINDRENWIERCRVLIHHLYRIHQSCMNQTVWTSGQFFWGTQGDNRPTTEEDLDVPVKRSSEPLSEQELDAILKNGLEKYHPVEYERIAYPQETFRPLHPVAALSSNTRESPALRGDNSNKLGLMFWAPEGTREVTFSVLRPRRGSNTGYDNFTVMDMETSQKFFKTEVPNDGDVHDLQIPIQKAGLYQIRILDNPDKVMLQFPENLPLGIAADDLRAPYNAGDPQENRAYFLVPAHLKNAAFTFQNPEQLEELVVQDLSGKPVPRKVVGHTAVFEVNNGPEPKIYELAYPATKERQILIPLNISPMLSLVPDNILVPSEAGAEPSTSPTNAPQAAGAQINPLTAQ